MAPSEPILPWQLVFDIPSGTPRECGKVSPRDLYTIHRSQPSSGSICAGCQVKVKYFVAHSKRTSAAGLNIDAESSSSLDLFALVYPDPTITSSLASRNDVIPEGASLQSLLSVDGSVLVLDL